MVNSPHCPATRRSPKSVLPSRRDCQIPAQFSEDRLSHPTVAHIGIAVPDLDAALAFYRDVLGVEAGPRETADGAAIVGLTFGGTAVELLAPRNPDGPIAKFLSRRGPGIHHICYRVADLDAALERCRAEGYRLIDDAPRPGAGGHRVAFVHPKATEGILIELTE